MKLAISLPDDLFRELDACAKRLRIPRSRLLAAGAREFLQRHAAADATAAWNAAIDAAGQPGDDAGAAALRKRAKRAVRGAARARW